ncbi:MAG: efflux RND transporter periplasmic adaptor subunit [Pseudomonadota bacterium]|nr:efflux RND transporter periplasmic adaptor subunit [Pseudomonadota bacterium]
MTATPERPRSSPKVIGVVLVVAVAVGVGAFALSGRTPSDGSNAAPSGFGQRSAAVTLAKVEFAPIEQSLTAIGTGRALQSLTLTAEVSGIIEKVSITPGAKVEKGFALVELEKDQQEIAVAKARADYAIARTNAQRFAGLVDDNAASALESESAQNALTAAQAELRRTEYELSQRTIRAPFAGIVGLDDLDVGDFISVGARITTIDDVSSLLVDFVIPETASAYVREGLEISATAASAGGRAFKGVIRAVDSRIDPASRTRRIEAVLANEDLLLLPGATFSINLAVPGRRAVAAPGLAVQWDRAGAYVWKRSINGVAERTPVVILQRTADAVLLDATLTESDYIVAEGADLVRAGAPLPDPLERGAASLSSAGSAAASQ